MVFIEEFESSDEIDDINLTFHHKTILRWYNNYNSLGHFPNHKMLNGEPKLPAILDLNPDLKSAVVTYCNDNLAMLTAESLHNYITTKCLPTLLLTRQKENADPTMTMKQLLQENRLQTFHPRTVNNLMNILGYKYCTCKKNYYNDKHESKQNILCRYKFIC